MKQLTREQKNLLLINQGQFIAYSSRDNGFPTPAAVADFKMMTSEIIENLHIPDAFIVQPMTHPADLIRLGPDPYDTVAITAWTQNLGACPQYEADIEWVQERLETALQNRYETARLEHGDDIRFFWCPYVVVVYMGIAVGGQAGRRCYATRYGHKIVPLTR